MNCLHAGLWVNVTALDVYDILHNMQGDWDKQEDPP
jgi:hypothetical protein